MINLIFNQFVIILPELVLTLTALFFQLSALLFSNKAKIIVNATILLSSILLLVTFQSLHHDTIGFSNSFASNDIINIYKAIVLFFTIITIIIYHDYCRVTNEEFKSEFITLTLLSTLGVFIAISSRNFLLLFCSMELQALIGYVLAGFSLNNLKSSEGALKYFILGSLVSCLMLLGLSFIYGFGGSLNYSDILHKFNQSSQPNIGLIVGLLLFLSGIFFKLSSVPLHIWTPDVYEGSPLPSVNYFATPSKIGNVIVLINVISLVACNYKQISIDLVKITAILSMLVGAVGATQQNSLKRLMGYSTILNIGYVLMSVSLNTPKGNQVAILYIIIYATGVTGFFACLIALLGKKSDTATFDDIKNIATSNKALAATISIIMFSMIGIPPLAGFFGKYYVLSQAIMQKQFMLAFVAIITSVMATFYYLKIVKYMYFFGDSNNLQPELATSSQCNYNGLKMIGYFTIIMLLSFSFLIGFVV